MKKISFLFFFIFVAQTWSYANTPARGPSVEPLVEIDIETEKKSETASGYDFNNKKPETVVAKRIPANIVSKTNPNKPSSYIGPFLFLLTLPIALWILVSKRFKNESSEKEVGYYAKTHQFPGTKQQYQSKDDDTDDIDYPKAS